MLRSFFTSTNLTRGPAKLTQAASEVRYATTELLEVAASATAVASAQARLSRELRGRTRTVETKLY